MTITRNIKIVFCLLMFPFCCAMAQEEYTWEMGGVIGGSFYMGDANSSTPFKDTGIAGGFIARYLLNPHMAIKGNLTAGRISGDTRDFKNVYPNGEYATFKRTIIDLGAQFEYNFLGYGIGNIRWIGFYVCTKACKNGLYDEHPHRSGNKIQSNPTHQYRMRVYDAVQP